MDVQTHKKREIIDITELVSEGLHGAGALHIFVTHTTAAITTADLDPGTDLDFLHALEAMTPSLTWNHPHNPAHFPDHLWASILGPSVTIPIRDGILLLGTWQRIVLVELDGPRTRHIEQLVLSA